MKTIRWINGIAVGLPLWFALISGYESGYIIISFLLMIFTGVIQIFIALHLYGNNFNPQPLRRYALMVLIYFLGWLMFSRFHWMGNYLLYYIFLTPAIPALFLTYIIHKN
jgi:hypothetical protein